MKYLRRFLDWLFEDSEEALFRIVICVGLGVFVLFSLLLMVYALLSMLHMIF